MCWATVTREGPLPKLLRPELLIGLWLAVGGDGWRSFGML